MAFEELKEDLMEAEADMRSYVESSEEYYRLLAFRVVMGHQTKALQYLLIGIALIFALLFLSFAASLAISERLESYFSGFMIIAGFYFILGGLFYLFRKRLNAPIIKRFSKYYFD